MRRRSPSDDPAYRSEYRKRLRVSYELRGVCTRCGGCRDDERFRLCDGCRRKADRWNQAKRERRARL